MVGCMIQFGKLHHIIPVCVPKSNFIHSQIVKQELPQFHSAAAGGTGIEQITDRLFGGSKHKTVSVFFVQRCTVWKHGNGNIPVNKGAKDRVILLSSALAAGGRCESIYGLRNQVMPGKRKLKGQIGRPIDHTG